MVTPKALVVRTAGTNCDMETKFAFENAGGAADLVHINKLAKENEPLAGYQILAIPGGFTYGDDVASGKVLAVELTHTLGEKIQAFVDKGGLVIGICNGFQVLVKTGLLPDARFSVAAERKCTLTFNDSHKFESRWVRMRAADNSVCIFAEPGEEFDIPVAHGEGKFVTRSPEVLKDLADNGQIVYRYIARDGSAPQYPEDPNGSIDHIAGICDKTGRIFGLMPHPERHLFNYHHPRWNRTPEIDPMAEGAGAKVFSRAVQYCKAG